MIIGQAHRWTVTGAVVLSTLSVVAGSDRLQLAGAVLLAVAILSWRGFDRQVRAPLTLWLVHGATVVIAALEIFRFFRILDVDPVLIIVMLGIANRLLLRTTQRDDLIILAAACVLIAAATTITPGVAFGFLILTFLPTLLWAMWSSNVLGASEREGPPGSPRRRAAWDTLARRKVPPVLARMAAGGLTLALAGFAVAAMFPRYQFGRFLGAGYFMPLGGAPNSMTAQTGGVSDRKDNTVLLRVEMSPHHREPSIDGLYARLYALDAFDGRTWNEGAKEKVQLYPRRAMEVLAPDEEWNANDGPQTVQLQLNRVIRGSIFHPAATLGRTGPSDILKIPVLRSTGGGWFIRNFNGTRMTYKVDLAAPHEPNKKELDEAKSPVLIALPDTLDPRVRQLGERLAAEGEDPKSRVRAVQRFLSSGFTYSLDPLEGQATDPLARFLFESKRGHCELYASALAVLLRIAKVPARVATGYYGGHFNSVGDYLVFTPEHAHAWVEVFYEGEGWRWIDATPPDLRMPRGTSMISWVRDTIDALEGIWYENVVDFDEKKRRKMMSSFSDSISSLFDGSDSNDQNKTDGSGGTRGRAMGPIFVVVALLGAGIATFVVLRRRARATPESLGRRLRSALGAKEENATLGTLLERVPPTTQADAAACVAIYEAFRFGPPREAPDVTDVIAAIEALESAKAHAPTNAKT